MKSLYLVRHAKSSWKNQGLADYERPLNKRGMKDAPFMGEVLNDKNIQPDLIISSPAKRAKKTVLEIADKIGYSQKKITFKDEVYEASSNTLIELIKKIDDKYNSVMIFGHNPGLTLLNNQISNHYLDNIPTCGIVALQLNKKWSELDKNSCEFLFFEHPKIHLE
jgi:phosphohistidine phosphatase